MPKQLDTKETGTWGEVMGPGAVYGWTRWGFNASRLEIETFGGTFLMKMSDVGKLEYFVQIPSQHTRYELWSFTPAVDITSPKVFSVRVIKP